MNLRPDQLPAVLDKPLAPLWLVHGNEALLVLEAADAIRAAAKRQAYDERETLVVGQGFKWDALTLAAGNLSLFGGAKLIDLRIPTGKPGRDGGDALQRYVAALPAQTLTLITLPELDWREEKAAWFTALANAGVAIKLNAPPLLELPSWISGRLRRQQQTVDMEGLKFIAERVEGNLLAAHQEIQKLALLYPAGKLSLQQVRDAVLNVARYDLDGLREALLAGDVGRLTRTLDGLMQEGEAPPLVLWAMSEEIRALAGIRAGLDAGRPIDLLLKDAKVWGPRAVPVKKAVQRLNSTILEAALRDAGHIDRMAKGAAQGNIWEAFLRLGLRLCGQKTASPLSV